MVADGLPCSLVHIYHAAVKVVMTASKDIEGSEDLESHFMSVLDEISEHVIVSGSFDTFPVSHIRSDFAVIKNLAHNRLNVDDNITESEVLALCKIEPDRVRSRECGIVRLTVEPHVIMINPLIIRS